MRKKDILAALRGAAPYATTLILILLLVSLLAGCTDSSAKRVLESQGFKEVELTGYRLWGCSDDDMTHTGFRAVGANGQPVAGVVCGGILFKNYTVRFD